MNETAGELKHVVGGEGPWVTLVHSLASDLTLLEAQARLLEAHSTAMGQALANGIDGARLHLIRGAAHQASIEQQADFDAQLDALFAVNA